MLRMSKGLIIEDVKEGSGKVARKHDTIEVHYTGWFYHADGTKGAKLDSSLDRGAPFIFKLGAGVVIPGWDEGLVGMKEGGKRILIIPPQLAYADKETLYFEVELLRVQ